MERDSVSGDNHKIWVVINQTRDSLLKARDRELDQYGTTAMQAGIMVVLKKLGGTSTYSELARYLFRRPNTISTLLIRMEKRGLVKRVRSGGERSLTHVTLTKRGEKVYEDTLKMESINNIMSCLSPDERRQLLDLMERVRDKALASLTPKFELPFP